PEDHPPAPSETLHEMLRTLDDEIPAQMGKAENDLTTLGMRPSLRSQWRSAVGAREPLSVQRRIPFSDYGRTEPTQKTLRNPEGSAVIAPLYEILAIKRYCKNSPVIA